MRHICNHFIVSNVLNVELLNISIANLGQAFNVAKLGVALFCDEEAPEAAYRA